MVGQACWRARGGVSGGGGARLATTRAPFFGSSQIAACERPSVSAHSINLEQVEQFKPEITHFFGPPHILSSREDADWAEVGRNVGFA